MDPNVLLNDIRSIVCSESSPNAFRMWNTDDLDELVEAVDNLRTWLKCGGYEPDWGSNFERSIVLKHLPPENSQF